MTHMKSGRSLLFLLGFLQTCIAAEKEIVGASVMGDYLYLCISREGRYQGRSYFGEQASLELRSWCLESREISLETGRTQRRWKADLKKELRLQSSVQNGFIGMAGENLYFKYVSALYRGPIHGRSNQHHAVILFNSRGLNNFGAFPTNVNGYSPRNPLPRLDGGLKVVLEEGAFLFTSNGVHQVASPLVASAVLAEDWKGKRTGGFEGLRLGTFGAGGEFLWHLRYPPGLARVDYLWDEPLELVQQVGEEVQVMPIRHRTAAVLWDGSGGTTVLSQGRNSGSNLRVDSPAGEGPNLGRYSGVLVADPTARTLVIIQGTKPEGVLGWHFSLGYDKHLSLRVFRVEGGKVVSREVKVVLD